MKELKKYIAPGGWFSLNYPAGWSEFEDEEGSFLFYHPEKWSGNFRISVFKDASASYAREVLAEELKANPQAETVKVGPWECVYSKESFPEEDKMYVTHLWITGCGDTVAECSFTTEKGMPNEEALQVIATLELRDLKKRYPKEVIPVRVLEINEINTAYEWAVSQIKKKLKKDFTAAETDVERIQQMIDGGDYSPKQRDVWHAFGIAFGTIVVDAIDGMEWVTVMDGRDEYPALRYRDTQVLVPVTQLIYEALCQGKPCVLKEVLNQIKSDVEGVM
jgi:hypothetical protein